MIGRFFVLFLLVVFQVVRATGNSSSTLVPYITNHDIAQYVFDNTMQNEDKKKLIQYFQKNWCWHLEYVRNFKSPVFLKKNNKKYKRPIRIAIIDAAFFMDASCGCSTRRVLESA